MTDLETKLYNALVALTTAKHADLGDMAYVVRERENEGWEGPAVKAWGKAIEDAETSIKEYEAAKAKSERSDLPDDYEVN